MCGGFGYINFVSFSALPASELQTMHILTDKLCSDLKVQTVSNRQVLGNAVF